MLHKLPYFSPFFANPQKTSMQRKLQMKLQTALKHVSATCVFGAENKIEDEIKTSGWSLYACYVRRSEGCFIKHSKATYLDQKLNGGLDVGMGAIVPKKRDWYFHIDQSEEKSKNIVISTYLKTREDPLGDGRFNITKAQNELLVGALLCQELRGATCHLRSNLIAKYLWEHPEGITRIEVVKASNFEHAFVIVNREGILSRPETWGNAFIVDSWYGEQNRGLVYSAAEFPSMIKKIKQFTETQSKLLKPLGIESPVIVSTGNNVTVCELVCEIRPQQQAYPTYSKNPFKPLEDYYGIDIYPKDPKKADGDFVSELQSDFRLHKAKMKNTFKAITAIQHDLPIPAGHRRPR